MFDLTIFQIIVIIIAILGSLVVFLRYNAGKMPFRDFSLWVILWIALVFISFVPLHILTTISKRFGFGRPLDFLLITAVIILFYLLFRVYLMIERIDQDITSLVEKLAIDNEDTKIDNSNGTSAINNNINNNLDNNIDSKIDSKSDSKSDK
ncbi:MAG: DUF2304 domain-containing protein [Methanobacteriaceae archaeon]